MAAAGQPIRLTRKPMEGETSPPPFGICTVNVGKHPTNGKDLPLQTVQAKLEDGSLSWDLPNNEPNLALVQLMEKNDPRFSHAIYAEPWEEPEGTPPAASTAAWPTSEEDPDLIAPEKPKPKK